MRIRQRRHPGGDGPTRPALARARVELDGVDGFEVHDMAFNRNFAIVNDFPLFWSPKLLTADIHLPRFHRDMPS